MSPQNTIRFRPHYVALWIAAALKHISIVYEPFPVEAGATSRYAEG